MAGTLTISTLSDGTNSTSSTNCIQGSAKAWAAFNGTNGTIFASYNISSVTVNSTGDYSINLTNAMVDANYSWTGTCRSSDTNADKYMGQPSNYANTASVMRVKSISGATNIASTFVSVAIFR